MAVQNTDIVDFISIDDDDGKVHLTIYDPLPWEDTQRLFTLQEKINAYLRFVDTGELTAKYPDAAGRHVCIDISFTFRPDSGGQKFLNRCAEIIRNAGLDFAYVVDSD